MNISSDREIATTTSRQQLVSTQSSPHQTSPDMLLAMWRYRWAVILPAIAGAVLGFLVYLQTPETYRSTTRLMIESDHKAMFDSMTGDVLGRGSRDRDR